MGLTSASTGQNLLFSADSLPDDTRLLVLAGSPNVGKSTVFNALTGLRQHTGNWTGKTRVHRRRKRIVRGQKLFACRCAGYLFALCALSRRSRCTGFYLFRRRLRRHCGVRRTVFGTQSRACLANCGIYTKRRRLRQPSR